MDEPLLAIEQTLTLLAVTPPRIAEATAGLTPAQLRSAPATEEWSINDVLAHLRACADVWGGCIATILAEDEPELRAVDPRTWIKQMDYSQLEFQLSLDAFTRQREGLLDVLRSLPDASWLRGATMTGSGRPIRRTALSFAQRLVKHERPHLKQIARVAAAMRP